MTWCPQCEWNLYTEKDEKPQSLFAKLYLQAGKKSSEGLLAAMLQNSALPPRFPLRKLLTLGACVLVHLISLSLFICGVYLLITQYASPLLVIGIILLLLAWSTRPRGYKLPAQPLTREHFPHTYQLMDELSASLGTGRVHGVIIDGKFNASVAHIGLSRKQPDIERKTLDLYKSDVLGW